MAIGKAILCVVAVNAWLVLLAIAILGILSMTTVNPATVNQTLELALLMLVTQNLAADWRADMPNCPELRNAVNVLVEQCGYDPRTFTEPEALDALFAAFSAPPKCRPRLTIVRTE